LPGEENHGRSEERSWAWARSGSGSQSAEGRYSSQREPHQEIEPARGSREHQRAAAKIRRTQLAAIRQRMAGAEMASTGSSRTSRCARSPSGTSATADEPDLWRALANPWRRRLLDLLRQAPATTGALASQLPEISRFAVMQHLTVLTEAGLVIAERRGRDRINYINPVPLREWYERWVQPMADAGSASLLALKRTA
jgi:DNA-binding transcriptional ArsR family regulator